MNNLSNEINNSFKILTDVILKSLVVGFPDFHKNYKPSDTEYDNYNIWQDKGHFAYEELIKLIEENNNLTKKDIIREGEKYGNPQKVAELFKKYVDTIKRKIGYKLQEMYDELHKNK